MRKEREESKKSKLRNQNEKAAGSSSSSSGRLIDQSKEFSQSIRYERKVNRCNNANQTLRANSAYVSQCFRLHDTFDWNKNQVRCE